VMDEDRLQGLREKPRPSAQLPDNDDEAELLRLQASQPCCSVIASSICVCCFGASVVCFVEVHVEVIGGH